MIMTGSCKKWRGDLSQIYFVHCRSHGMAWDRTHVTASLSCKCRSLSYVRLPKYSRHALTIHTQCSKHVEGNSVTDILLMNKELCIKVG